MRVVWPSALQLLTTKLEEAHAEGLEETAALKFAPHLFEQAGENEFGPGIALRWVCSSALGIPRQPFRVFRRPAADAKPDIELMGGESEVSGTAEITWSAGQMFVVEFVAEPDPGAQLVVTAIDAAGEPVPAQRIVFSNPRRGQFRCPGITQLRVQGSGVVRSVIGVEQTGYANADGWQLIEVVGLPFEAGELPEPIYVSGIEQGFADPTPSLSGHDAARLRLAIAQAMRLPLPAHGVAGVAEPPWPVLDPDQYLNEIRGPMPAPLALLTFALEQSDDDSFDKRQGAIVHEQAIEGLRQADTPGAAPGEPAQASVPVIDITMMTVSADGDAATGLGFGTIDLPSLQANPLQEAIAPPGLEPSDWDYMISSAFSLPLGFRIEVAALGCIRPALQPAADLATATVLENRAIERDAPESEAVRLSWRIALFPQSYVMFRAGADGLPRYLNLPHPRMDGIVPFFPARPPYVNGAPPAGHRSGFADPVVPVPFAGNLAFRFFVMATNVFGRWASWRITTHTSTAPPPLKPGLDAVRLEQAATTATPPVVPARLEIEFSWDWSDRSPDRIVFAGRFVALVGDPPPTFPTLLQRRNTGGERRSGRGPVRSGRRALRRRLRVGIGAPSGADPRPRSRQ